ncbi:actin-like ATPase domain-containing protein [Gigaspora margarita]|uniref:Actin-like ATPase domain-containing protein n=1 Tax=Gigaspora margarita TaxID=4874 RepID=A0A8H4ER03_GIGMA|nr:actin-like ATPase domain-containing protein [Gigaspora margarita]
MSEASNIDEIPTLEEIDKLDLSFKKLFDTSLKVEEINDIRVVASIDFGTTYSGYAYAHLKTQPLNIITHTEWQEYDGMPKVPTVLKYNESFEVVDWGYPALINLDRKNLNQKSNMKPVELFKLYLSNNDEMENMPYLPSGIDYKQAIVDFLRNMGDSLKEELKQWDNIDYFKNVRLVLTVPVEFDNDAISTMRDCAYKAGLTKQKHNSYGSNLLFVHEPEAAAVHCLKTSGECDLSVGDTFMVVDSGGGTVDITTMKWLKSGKLSEIIESKGDYCGGNYVDQEFLKFLAKKVGDSTIKNLKEHHYGQIQYVIHVFNKRIKYRFTGKHQDFTDFELDLDDTCPIIKKYVKDTIRDELESSMWVITIKYDDVKKMFDPIIDKIITLIHGRLEALDSNCSAMLLVGGFSESKYLRSRIRNEFKKIVPNISSPSLPMLAIVKGAVQFGASQKIIVDRILKWTYGTDVIRKWKPSDPLDRKIDDDHIIVFSRLAKKGEKVAVGEKVVRIFSTTHVVQHFMGLDLYVTHDEDAEYCDSPGVELLDTFTIKVPITGEKKREIIYIMNFGMVEIQVTAINPNNRVKYERVFNLDI